MSTIEHTRRGTYATPGPLLVGRSVSNKRPYRGPLKPASAETLAKRAQEARALARGTCSTCHMLLPASGECC